MKDKTKKKNIIPVNSFYFMLKKMYIKRKRKKSKKSESVPVD